MPAVVIHDSACVCVCVCVRVFVQGRALGSRSLEKGTEAHGDAQRLQILG